MERKGQEENQLTSGGTRLIFKTGWRGRFKLGGGGKPGRSEGLGWTSRTS